MIEPATFRFEVQCLDQLRHRVPLERDIHTYTYVQTLCLITLKLVTLIITEPATCVSEGSRTCGHPYSEGFSTDTLPAAAENYSIFLQDLVEA
jgi:hypothetical protein